MSPRVSSSSEKRSNNLCSDDTTDEDTSLFQVIRFAIKSELKVLKYSSSNSPLLLIAFESSLQLFSFSGIKKGGSYRKCLRNAKIFGVDCEIFPLKVPNFAVNYRVHSNTT